MTERINTIANGMLQKNKDMLYSSKVLTAIGSGIVSGALGFVHYQGFLFMFICYCLITGCLFIRLAPSLETTFTSKGTILTEAWVPFVMVCFSFFFFFLSL